MLTEGGFNLQRYNADGTPGSSWYPLSRDGEERLPIQEDETALINYALWHHYHLQRLREIALLLEPDQKDWRFLSAIEIDSGLPLPSFDLWEERRVCLVLLQPVYAGLNAAANLQTSSAILIAVTVTGRSRRG